MAEVRVERTIPSVSSVSHLFWGAVFGGSAVTLVTVMLLVLFGIAVGLFAVDPATEQNPLGGIGIGSAIWWVLSWVVALFFGGWVTSRFAGLQRKFDGLLHGLVTWSLTFLFSLFFLTNVIGTVVGGTFGMMSTIFSAASEVVSVVAPEATRALTGDDPMQVVIQEAQQVIEQVRQRGGQNAVQELTTALREIFKDPQMTQAEEQRIVSLLLQYTDMSRDEASSLVNRWADTYENARQRLGEIKEQLPQRAEQITEALARAALWAFLALLLGAVAAAAGGMVGRVKGEVNL
jgi:hypothetical protein